MGKMLCAFGELARFVDMKKGRVVSVDELVGEEDLPLFREFLRVCFVRILLFLINSCIIAT